jgi:PAS domain S-box-containing protein
MTLEQAQHYFTAGQHPRGTEQLDEEQMRVLSDSIPQIVWSARPDGYLDHYNARWYEFTGFPRGEGGDKSWKSILHPEDAQPCLDAWHRAVGVGESHEMEFRFRDRHTGSYRWHLWRALPIKTATGRVTRWFGTCTDIHEHKEALRALEKHRDALRETNRRKDQFLAILAHEMRTPLASVVSAVELLRTGDGADCKWASEVIARQAGQLTRLIDDLLDVARINSGKICLNREPLDLATVLNRAVEATRPAICEKQHVLATEYPQQILFLNGDPVRLEQIVVNLLNNAAKYTPPGGHLSLRAGQNNGKISIVVGDDGLGIPAQKLPEIFDLFEQGGRSSGRSQDGLGLGLTIVKKLAELHGGSVSASSAGPGFGSTFAVQLPAPEDVPVVPPPQNVSPIANSCPARILVVDDHIDSANGLARLLQRRGHQLEIAYDGRSAFLTASKFLPEVFLLDLDLPEMDGCQVAAHLRQDANHRRSLLIALTGHGHEEDRKRCLEAGFDHHVLKPVDLETLQGLIADYLAKRG